MSKLLIDELATSGTLFQSFTVSTSNLLTKYYRLNLYKHGHPPGGVIAQIRDTNGKVIKATSEVLISAIDADISSADFYHGMVRFDLDQPLKKNTTYQIALKAGGSYAFNETASGSTGYIGWCRNYDLKRIESDYAQDVGVNSPLDFEIWQTKIVEKG